MNSVNSSNVVIQRCVRFGMAITLTRYRWVVTATWPDVAGMDRSALVIWSALSRYHAAALRLMWKQGHWIRRLLRPRPVDPSNRVVLHLTGSFDLGGTQTQIKNLCTARDSMYTHRASEVFPELNFLYRRDATIDVERYVKHGLLSRTLGRLVTDYNRRSSQLLQIYKFLRDIQAERPEVVVGWGHEMCVTAFVAAALARVPHVIFCIRTVNPTNYLGDHPLPKLLLCAHRRMLPMVSKVVVNSTLLHADYAAWVGMPAEQIAICTNGIDCAPLSSEEAATVRRRVRAEHAISDDTVVIVSVGRFSPEKAHATIVETNRLLLARGTAPDFVWLLCGDGPTMSRIKDAVERLGMTNIRFLGRTERVQDVLTAADVFVMASDFEGMPNAMMEAMAIGLPCVSTNRTGALDVARPNREALYCEPRDALGLAQHLERLLQQPAARLALGRAAAARIREFSVDRLVNRFEAILDDVLANR